MKQIEKRGKGVFILIVCLVLFSILQFASVSTTTIDPLLHDYNSVKPEIKKLNFQGTIEINSYLGASTYSYQVKIPPGINNFQPTVKIYYNSHNVGKNSENLGLSWKINQNYVQRDTNYTFTNFSDDEFKLIFDGNLYDLVYSKVDKKYHTKTEDFLYVKNESDGNNTNDQYWIVKTKDGTIYRFGYYENSELVSNLNSYSVRWSLDLINNTFGNSINYTYKENLFSNDAGAVYLDKIEYDGRKIEFIYKELNFTDQELIYINGNSIRYSGKLKEIIIYVENKTISKGVISYDFFNKIKDPLIKNISLFGETGESLKSNQFFEYYISEKGWSDETSNWPWNGRSNNDLDFFLRDGNRDTGIRLIDVNGDGLADLTSSGKSWINTGAGWERDDNWILPVDVKITDYSNPGVKFADINGDGLIDLMRSDYMCNAWQSCKVNGNYPDPVEYVWINNGDGWSDETSNWPWNGRSNNDLDFFLRDGNRDTGIRLIDVNGDGLADLTSSGKSWINTGAGWERDDNWILPVDVKITDYSNPGVKFADINGDGLIDLMRSDYMCNAWQSCKVNGNYPDPVEYVWINKHLKNNLLKSIINEYGGKIYFDYKKSTFFDNTGIDNLSDLGFNLWVIKNITKNDGMGNNFTTHYNYSGGVYDYQDKEFRGFNFVEEKIDDKITRYWFHQDDARKGLAYKSEISDSQDNLLFKTEQVWNSTDKGGYYLIELLEKLELTYDGNSTSFKMKNTSYEYDDFGNIKKIYHKGDVNNANDDRYEYFNFLNNSNRWIINRIKNYSLFGSDGYTKFKETLYTYDGLEYGEAPNKGDLTSKEDWLDNGKNSIINYSYNDYGNLVNETDTNGRTTRYEYDSTNTFVEKTINAKGQIENYKYDLGTGNLLWEIDSNGRGINYTYDVFGRIIKEIHPYDTEIYPTKEYQYEFDGVAPEKIKISYLEESGLSNTFDEYYFYDGFNRLIQSKQEAENSKQIVKDIYYDELGKISMGSNPYFVNFYENYSSPNQSINKIDYTYDQLGRTIRTINPDNSKKRTEYKLWNISYYDENANKIDKIMDATGNIIGVIEYGKKHIGFYNYSIYSGEFFNIIDKSVSYYMFEQTTGPVVDFKKIKNGENVGSIRGVNGHLDNAFNFDGINDYVHFSETVNHRLGSGNFTVSFWFKTGNLSGVSSLVNKKQHNGQNDYLFMRDGNTVYFNVWSGDSSGGSCSNNPNIVSSQIETNRWYFVVGRFDSSKKEIELFLDNVSQGTQSTPTSQTCYNWDAAGGPKNLRISGNHFNIDYFGGIVDELGLWKMYLNDEEIGELYNPDKEIIVEPTYNYSVYSNTHYNYDISDNLISIVDNGGNIFNWTYDSLGREIKIDDPDLGIWNYTYDEVGNLIKQVDNRGVSTYLKYDELNRLVQKNSSNKNITYIYDLDKNGTLSQIKSEEFEIKYTYDNRLRKIGEIKIIGQIQFISNWTYDAMNRIGSETLPDGVIITYDYNDQGKMKSIDSILNISYNEQNQLLTRTYDNNLLTNYSYNQDNFRLTRVKTGDKQELNYTYDLVGNIKQINDVINFRSFSMIYDDLDRLIYTKIINYTFGEDKEINFTYNEIGNMLNVIVGDKITIFDYVGLVLHAPSFTNTSDYVVPLSSKINLDLISPITDTNVTQNKFFKVVVNVTCADNDCGEINVSFDPKEVNVNTKENKKYTSFSETICSNGVCNREIYSGVNFVKENGNWKNIKEISSLKDSGFKINFIEEDPNYPLEIMDFNYTHIKVKLDSKLNKDTDLKIWKYNSIKGKKIKGKKNKELKNYYKESYDKIKEKKIKKKSFGKEYVFEFRVGEILEFGDNSTTIQYNFNSTFQDDEMWANMIEDLGTCTNPPASGNDHIPTCIIGDGSFYGDTGNALDSSDNSRFVGDSPESDMLKVNATIKDIEISSITQLNWTFEGQAYASGQPIEFYMWNFTDGDWYNCASDITGGTDVLRNCVVTDTNNFIDSNNKTYFIAYAGASGSDGDVLADFVKLEIIYSDNASGNSSGNFSTYNLTITEPTTSNTKSVNSGDNITLRFNFLENGTNVTSGVTINNITIGGVQANVVQTSEGESCVNETETFESSFLPTGWTTGGDANFFKSSNQAYGGTYSAEGGNIDNNEDTWIRSTKTFCSSPQGGVEFNWKVNSEGSWDYLGFCGENTGCTFHGEESDTSETRISGSTSWASYSNLSGYSGETVLEWAYRKDSWTSTGSDTGWIDSVTFYNVEGNSSASDEFEYIAGVGWEVNVTVPTFASGLKDLFINVSYDGNVIDDLEINAINYGGSSETKSGLISTVVGTIPFYTNDSNPRTISLNKGQSQLVTAWINATGDSGSNYTFFVYANKTSNLSISNITDSWTVMIVNESEIEQRILLDLVNPLGSNINVTQNEFFNVLVNVTCKGVDCGEINVSLDPTPLFEEDFENGNKGDFDFYESWGGGSLSYDNNSLIDGSYSLKSTMTTEGKASLLENLGSDYETLYFQFKTYLPSGWSFGSGSYFGIFDMYDSSNNSIFYMNVEDWGNLELTFGGDVSWTDSGEILPINDVTKVEVMVTKKVNGGAIKLWLDNDVEGSPNYSNTNINTGNTNIRSVSVGSVYADDSHDPIYHDNVIVSESFIGAESSEIKSGLISAVIGDTPFYTNESNPRTINLNKDQSQLVLFWVNATGDLSSTHEFFAFVNKTSNMALSNITNTWDVTII